MIDTDTEEIRAADLRVGDLVDLESRPYLHDEVNVSALAH